MNKLEKSWILYDIGNSVFTLIISMIIPIFFKEIVRVSRKLTESSSAS